MEPDCQWAQTKPSRLVPLWIGTNCQNDKTRQLSTSNKWKTEICSEQCIVHPC